MSLRETVYLHVKLHCNSPLLRPAPDHCEIFGARLPSFHKDFSTRLNDLSFLVIYGVCTGAIDTIDE